MRDPKTLDLFYDTMKKVHKEYYPDYRPAQFLLDFLGYIHNVKGVDSFFLEYDKMLDYLDEYIKQSNPLFKGGNLFEKDGDK